MRADVRVASNEGFWNASLIRQAECGHSKGTSGARRTASLLFLRVGLLGLQLPEHIDDDPLALPMCM